MLLYSILIHSIQLRMLNILQFGKLQDAMTLSWLTWAFSGG